LAAGTVGVALGFSMCGCAEKAPEPPTGVATAKKTPPALTSKPAADAAAESAKTAEPENVAASGGPTLAAPAHVAAVPTATEKHEEKAAADAVSKTEAIVLGSEELTAGIPGKGPLAIAEIKTWLAKPGVNEPMKVKLPLGLDAGAGQVKGLEKNPLTRAKIELGRQLYFDNRLSADNSVSCGSCHDPSKGWARETQFGEGIKGQKGNRNSPVSFNRILSDAQFWDGRAESLEAQAVGPIANPIEMGNTHEKAVAAVKKVEGYQVEFESIFGKDGVTIDNIAKAIASFERAVVTGPSPFDYYEALIPFKKLSKEELDDLKKDDPEVFAKYQNLLGLSKEHPMSESAIRGRDLFFGQRVNCSACHVGANLTDEKYHNLGIGMDNKQPDLGRFAISKNEKERGAFKTPTVRNVALTPPYMHDGSQKNLDEVVDWYDKGGHPNPHLDEKIKPLKLTAQEKKDLVEFLKACTGEIPKVQTGRLPQA
jgi:cytochrome c peroxidase